MSSAPVFGPVTKYGIPSSADQIFSETLINPYRLTLIKFCVGGKKRQHTNWSRTHHTCLGSDVKSQILTIRSGILHQEDSNGLVIATNTKSARSGWSRRGQRGSSSGRVGTEKGYSVSFSHGEGGLTGIRTQ